MGLCPNVEREKGGEREMVEERLLFGKNKFWWSMSSEKHQPPKVKWSFFWLIVSLDLLKHLLSWVILVQM
jgi:hypothetical protein